MRPVQRGSEDKAIRRSRGGLSTKISAGVDEVGNPLALNLPRDNQDEVARSDRRR